jgi:hypothetical protein
MTSPKLPANASKRELRKALIQMRMELHRQQLQHETLLLTKPLQSARNLSQQWSSVFGQASAPVLGAVAAGVLAFAFIQRKQLSNWITLGSALSPLLKLFFYRASPATSTAPEASAAPNDSPS